MRNDSEVFLPKTLLQWVQTIGLVIGIAAVIYSYFDKLNHRIDVLDERLIRVEYRLEIKK